MLTIVLRGKLGKKFPHPDTGRKWQMNVRSVSEGLRGINANMPGFFDYIEELESEMQGYHVQVGKRTIGADMLSFRFNDNTVTITPILQGADTKGIITIIAGVALIAIGWATYGSSAFWGTQLILAGLAISLGGVARLLISAPPQTLGTQDKTRSSYVFTGAINTVQQGECVPVAYGDLVTGSAVVAAGMESIDVHAP